MTQQECPKCGTAIRGDRLVCDKCGTLLFDPKASTVHLRVDPAILKLRRKAERQTGQLALGTAVGMQIRGLVVRLEFEEGTEVVMGRIDLSNPDFSRFDLTPYGGHERGVSREHALMRYGEGKLTITDLASANGTMVNLQKLAPGEPTLIKDGDEIILGNLAIKIIMEGQV
ncbi:MAG: FHA domain-containing protein [Anaerolineales bacterium]|nr:FHA domain-containing protein [Anaerolineales bacterium]